MSDNEQVAGSAESQPRSEAWKTALTVLQSAKPPFVPEGAEATTVLVEFPPGDPGTPPHRHSGPAFGYMLEGEMLFELEGEPERVIKAGETFWEPGGDVIHYQDGNNRTDSRSRFLVTMMWVLETLVFVVVAVLVALQPDPAGVQLLPVGALGVLVRGGSGVSGGVQAGGDRVGAVGSELCIHLLQEGGDDHHGRPVRSGGTAQPGPGLHVAGPALAPVESTR